jgi:hypothetical protein
VTGIRGVGDRWLAGEPIDGIAFGFKSAVELADGRNAGRRGTVVLLMDVSADPLYLVELGGQGGAVRVRQSSLRPATWRPPGLTDG